MMSSQTKSNCKCALTLVRSLYTYTVIEITCVLSVSFRLWRQNSYLVWGKWRDVPWLVDKIADNLIYLMLNQCYSCWMRLKNQEGVVFYVVHLFKKITLRLRRFVTTFFFSLCFLGSCPGSEVFLLLESRFSSPNN